MDTARIRWVTELLTETELDLVIETLSYEREAHGSHFVQLADPMFVRRTLKAISSWGQVGKCYIDGNFAGIVYWDLGAVWWSPETILMEQLVLCVNPYFAGFGRRACDYLEQIAKENHINIIVAGCLFQKNPQMITNLYKKKGFLTVNPLYIKQMGGTE